MLLLAGLRPLAGQAAGCSAAAPPQILAAALRRALASAGRIDSSSSSSSSGGGSDAVLSSAGGTATATSSAGGPPQPSTPRGPRSGGGAAAAWAPAAPWPSQLLHFRQRQQQQHQQQQLLRQWAPPPASRPLQPQSRAFRGAAKRVRFELPAELQAARDSAASRPPREPAPPVEPRELQFTSRRAGLLAIKAGMTQEWDEFGARVPLTVLWIDDCRVVRHKTEAADGVTALVLGAGIKKDKQLNGRELGEFKALGAEPARRLWEVPVTPDALLPPGTPLTAAHFVAGQYLDVTGVTRGKGFAGVMKRWGFSGQPASHGNTKSHRRPGSIGGRTDPGKVWKGKKMAGRMGGDVKTVKNVWLYKVDPARNLLYVRGQVPGPVGSFLLLRDAFRWHWDARASLGLPFPTASGAASEVSVARRDGQDPYERYRSDVGEYLEGGASWKTE